MEQNTLSMVIRNLGYSYDSLIQNRIISSLPLSKLYEDSDTLEIEIDKGFEMVFSESLLRFEMIYIILEAGNPRRFMFQRNLPSPLCLLDCKSNVDSILGKPIHSASQIELFDSDLFGWDTYQLPENLHPESFLEVQYDADMNVKNLVISLMDRD